MNRTKNYHFQVGNLKCIAISDWTEIFPVETIVKDVSPEQLRQALLEGGYSQTENTIYYNCLYIQTDQHRILIDTGMGKDTQQQAKALLDFLQATQSPSTSAVPALRPRDGALLDRLQAEGITSAEIDLVIITHGDGDHIGGIANSDHQLVFPKATFVLSKEAWDFWFNEALVAQWPAFLTAHGRRIFPLIKSRIKVVEPGDEFLPGFQAISAPGHRPGHTALAITSAGKHLLHVADTVGHPILVEHPSWHGYADSRHDQAEKDRVQLLSQAVSQQALVFGSHLPFPGVGHIIPRGEGWRWQPLDKASS
jgi:glyoxylase-like metal-dependent hydrolase (beta-lactamase superfamily II)